MVPRCTPSIFYRSCVNFVNCYTITVGDAILDISNNKTYVQTTYWQVYWSNELLVAVLVWSLHVGRHPSPLENWSTFCRKSIILRSALATERLDSSEICYWSITPSREKKSYSFVMCYKSCSNKDKIWRYLKIND